MSCGVRLPWWLGQDPYPIAREVLESEGLAVAVAIVDLNLPDGSDADSIRDLQRSRPRAMALVLSATSEEKYLAKAIDSGAAAVMHKSTPMSELVGAVRRLATGEQLLGHPTICVHLRKQVSHSAHGLLLDFHTLP